MAKGFRKKLNVPKTRKIKKKNNKWTVKASPGPHPAEESVPLKVALKDHLESTQTGKEAEKIIKEGKIKIDGKTIKKTSYPIGFMDIVTIVPIEQNYRTGFDRKGRIEFTEIDEDEAKYKLGRIKKKHTTKNGKIQITLHDGRTLNKEDVKVGDTVKLNLEDQEIEKIIEMKEGNQGYIISGKHAGEILEITEIIQGTSQRKPLVKLGEITTQKENVFAIGEKEPELKIDE